MPPLYASQAWLSESANDPSSGGGSIAILIFIILILFVWKGITR